MTTLKIMSRLVIWPSMMLLGWTETNLWTLKYYGSKSIQTSLLWKKCPPKPYTLKIFYQFCDNCDCLPIFKYTVSKLETFVWILNHISRFIAWSLFTLKTSYLVKWPISKWSFMWWCQFIDLLNFETHPSSLLNFGMAHQSTYGKFIIIGHFRVLLCLFFKASLSAKPFISKWVLHAASFSCK